MPPNLARGVFSEVGVLTDHDVELYRKTLPTLSQPDKIKKSVAALTLRAIRNSLQNDIGVQARIGNDMSGLVPYYQELTDKIDSMESDLGIKSDNNNDNDVDLYEKLTTGEKLLPNSITQLQW